MNMTVKSLGIENLKIGKELQDALNEYTTKKGLEVRSWTGDNIFHKIETISKKYGQKIKDILNIGLFNVYRHASEIAHGTLFGLFYIIGATDLKDRPKDTNELIKFHRQHLTLIILTVCMLNEANLTFMNDFADLKEEISQAKKITLEFAQKSK